MTDAQIGKYAAIALVIAILSGARAHGGVQGSKRRQKPKGEPHKPSPKVK